MSQYHHQNSHSTSLPFPYQPSLPLPIYGLSIFKLHILHGSLNFPLQFEVRPTFHLSMSSQTYYSSPKATLQTKIYCKWISSIHKYKHFWSDTRALASSETTIQVFLQLLPYIVLLLSHNRTISRISHHPSEFQMPFSLPSSVSKSMHLSLFNLASWSSY